MRVWKYAEQTTPKGSRGTISERGLHLLLVEFMVRNPCGTCVMTSPAPGLENLAGLFPGTTFHVYCLFAAMPESTPNVIHHACVFDRDAAEGWSIRRGMFNLVFIGDGMDRQMSMFITAMPRAGLLLITEPPEHYLEGEIVFPLWCAQDSHLCGLVVKPRPDGSTKGFWYGAQKYTQGMVEFQSTQRGGGGTGYDTGMETMILGLYTATQCADQGAASLL
jgi:hypothetical protein